MAALKDSTSGQVVYACWRHKTVMHEGCEKNAYLYLVADPLLLVVLPVAAAAAAALLLLVVAPLMQP